MRIYLISTIKIILFFFCIGSLHAQDYVITDFGAKTDQNNNNAQAIQKAIDRAALKGGTVIVPSGTFFTGSIQLKSNTTLQLNKNAVLKGIASKNAYPSIPIKYQIHSMSGQSGHALIYASGVKNISITGEGTIDGNGEDLVFETKNNEHTMRPYGILIESCTNVTVSGIYLQNSAMWMQRYLNCDFLTIKGIKVFNHANLNNDGLDIDDCHNVIISDCIIDADDDALCFKSEGDRGVKNAVVTNCILATHASAFKMGTGSTGGFESIQFSNTVIRQSLATNMKHPFKQKSGLTGIDLASSDGAIIRDINISNISIDSLENPIFIKLGNRLRRTSKTQMEKKGRIEGIHFTQITIKNAGISPSTITGFPKNYIRDINFRDIFIEHKGTGTSKDTSLVVDENSDQYPGTRMFKRVLPATAFYLRHIKNISFDNIQLKLLGSDARAAVVADDVEALELQNLKVPGGVIVKDSKDVTISLNDKNKNLIKQINSNAVNIN